MTEIREKKVRLNWGSLKDVPQKYANHLQVSFMGGTEFHITFGHLTPPLTHGLDEKDLPSELEIEPTVVIITSHESMKAFIKVLSESMEHFEKMEKGS